MSSLSLTLDAFIQPVPVGEPTTNLATALKMFHSDCRAQTMAIVNRRGLPLGAIRCRCLLSYILKHLGIESTAPSGSRASLKQLQSSLARIKLQSLMEPVTILPARMRVNELPSHLQERQQNLLDDSLYVLTDERGKFVGLLDSCALLKSLLANSPEERDKTARQPAFVLEEVFFQAIEQLPLPIMAYASGGRILYRNLHWREQIGEFFPIDEGSFCPLSLEPTKVSDAGVPLLSRGAIAELNPDVALDCLNDDRYLAAQLSRRQLLEVVPELLTVEDSANSLPSFARSQNSKFSSRLGQPKTVGDRAWQFVKFPLQLQQSDRAENFPISFHSPTWLVIATEVTEHQRLCKELSAKNADLVQLNRLKDEFLACISHELKSPLTAVLGLSSLLKEQKLGELNQRQVRYAQLIYQSGRQLMDLVNDLLDLTRLETGQLQLNFAPVQVRTVCEQAYGAIEEQHKRKIQEPIAFSLEIEPGLETIIADELRLRQILIHLLDNAVKFTPAGKPIGLKVNRWENWIAFTVWDRGIGIPEEHQHLIFQKFQQLESPLTRQFEGTGLGLFLTQRLARAHGGDISFISKVGVGSQFTLLLPPNSALEKGGETEGQQRHPLVLVVEAIPQAIEDLTEKLSGLGYRVAIARTGTEALEKARQLQPHAIFVNPSLPLLSGWDVLTLLKSNEQTKKIRVIVTATQSDQTKSQQYGANGFLSLPVELGALREILNESENQPASKPKRLTILRLYPQLQTSSLGDSYSLGVNSFIDLTLIAQLPQLNHRILEADDLEQAEMLSRVWKIDAVILDSTILGDPLDYLRLLGQCEQLSTLPLITLDAQTTEAANRVGNLSVFPCLIPADRHNCDRLLQVIQIAAQSKNQDYET